jgi:hypothetical protein
VKKDGRLPRAARPGVLQSAKARLSNSSYKLALCYYWLTLSSQREFPLKERAALAVF